MWHQSKYIHAYVWVGQEELWSAYILPVLSCVYPKALIQSSVLCISRYAYDVNITLHLPLLNTVGVCSFITVSSYLEEWIEPAEFALHTADWILSEESISSHGCTVFTLAPGKQQINVTQCRWYHQPAKTPETMSASPVGSTCAACCDHTCFYSVKVWHINGSRMPLKVECYWYIISWDEMFN